jgi:hypothetical protein
MSQLPSGWIPERPLEEDIEYMQTDVLSARCRADRLRLKSELHQVASAASPESVQKLLSDLRVVLQFVGDIAKVQAAKVDLGFKPSKAKE